MNNFPDDQERVWIEIEHESIRKQAVFDLPTKTFTPEGERAYHANEIEAWSPIED